MTKNGENLANFFNSLIDWSILSIQCVLMDWWLSVREGFYDRLSILSIKNKKIVNLWIDNIDENETKSIDQKYWSIPSVSIHRRLCLSMVLMNVVSASTIALMTVMVLILVMSVMALNYDTVTSNSMSTFAKKSAGLRIWIHTKGCLFTLLCLVPLLCVRICSFPNLPMVPLLKECLARINRGKKWYQLIAISLRISCWILFLIIFQPPGVQKHKTVSII